MALTADLSGSVWKLLVKAGDAVEQGQVVAILESMKMEVSVCATQAGTIESVDCGEGAAIVNGQRLMVLRAESRSTALQEESQA